MESKKDIRNHVLAKRNCISQKEWEEKSYRIYNKVVTHPFFLDADAIYCYIDYRNEVGTRQIIKRAWDLQKKVAVPKVEGTRMQFYYIQDFSELVEGYKGILEPRPLASANDDNALVIIPGAVFDKNRNRIGYGKGFYDKFLSCHQTYRTMAVGFEMQMMEQIPSDPHDVCPEILITEENIYA